MAVKGLSRRAMKSIVKARAELPFASLGDFLARTKANKRVVASLLSAGSLRDLVPNTKAALEHLDRLMKLKESPKIDRFIEASRAHDDFDKERLDEIAADVNPFVIRIHPIEKAAELVERVGLKVKLTTDVAANDSGFILGFVSDVKEGEFEGSRFATMEIDTGSVKVEKYKLDSSLTAALDAKGLGLPTFVGDIVVAHYLRSYKLPTLQFVVSLSDLDNELRAGKKLDVWSRLVRGELPPTARVLANIRTIVDRNRHEMAFLTVMSNARAVEGVCFASTWGEVKGELKVGTLVSVAVKKEIRDGKTSIIFSRIRRAPLP
jgi:DNA polymerase III alpha subunit